MNGDFFTNAAQPTAEESVPGGSYLPSVEEPSDFRLRIGGQQTRPQSSATPSQQPKQIPNLMRDSARGKASDINDFGLTIAGIADGDPVGLETFDLGFFEDGTPAIVINGANVPIRHEQWMALMSMRNKTRSDMQARMEFDQAKNTAIDAIRKVEASVALPDGLIPLVYAQAQFDPSGALKSLSDVYRSVQSTGGKDLMGDIASKVQEQSNSNSIDPYLRSQGEQVVTKPPLYPGGPNIEERVKTPSIRDQKARQLSASSDPKDQITAFAWMKLEDFTLSPEIRRAAPTRRMGILDRIRMEADRTGPMSLMARLQHIAAYNGGAWPQSIPMEPGPMIGLGATPQEQMALSMSERQRVMDYLARLDRWGSEAFGYKELSTPEAYETAFQDWAMATSAKMGISQRAVEQASPGYTTQSTVVPPSSTAPSGRPRAVPPTTTGQALRP